MAPACQTTEMATVLDSILGNKQCKGNEEPGLNPYHSDKLCKA
jgi:hypothetical protein